VRPHRPPSSAGSAATSADGKPQQDEAAKGVLVIDLTGDSIDDADEDEEVKWVREYSSAQSISFSSAKATSQEAGQPASEC
jgi:hypothetical protein